MGVAGSSRHLEDDVDQGGGLRDLPVYSGTERAWRNARGVELKVADGVVTVCQASAGCRGRSRGHPQVVLVDIPANSTSQDTCRDERALTDPGSASDELYK